jgi:hypothetical protein
VCVLILLVCFCCWLQLKDVLMATYFAADHVVWAYQIGVISDKKIGERLQKVSLWSWALGSVLTMIMEANAILSVSTQRSVMTSRHAAGASWHRLSARNDICLQRTQVALAISYCNCSSSSSRRLACRQELQRHR